MTRPISRRDSLKAMGGMAVAGLSSARAAAQPPPPRRAPNILFFMTDDQRQDAVSAYGNRILKTPHMDRIGPVRRRCDRCPQGGKELVGGPGHGSRRRTQPEQDWPRPAADRLYRRGREDRDGASQLRTSPLEQHKTKVVARARAIIENA
jgi:hypothetical protein